MPRNGLVPKPSLRRGKLVGGERCAPGLSGDEPVGRGRRSVAFHDSENPPRSLRPLGLPQSEHSLTSYQLFSTIAASCDHRGLPPWSTHWPATGLDPLTAGELPRDHTVQTCLRKNWTHKPASSHGHKRGCSSRK